MEPRNPMQSAGRKYREVLKVALAPSPVACREIQQRGGTFFETAAERRRHSDRPSPAPHQGCFNKIVAQNMTAERFSAPQLWQAGVLCKRAHPDDRIMSPVVTFRAVPP